MENEIELLAPGGDIDCIKAAILAGANAVYCGLNRFNARNRATNINFENLNGILNLAHKNNCKVFLTLNIIIVTSEIPAVVRELNKLINTDIDGIIIQDLGMFYLLSRYFSRLEIHASTQLNTHNKGQIKFLSKLTAARVNLSRELNLHEIKALTITGHENNVCIEIFVHGSYCLSFSGLCYISSVHGGNSGNRGRCSQPCRDRYLTTPAGRNFPLNLKDNSAYLNLKEISDAGVDSIKIEGRIKKFDYVYTIVDCWNKQLQRLYRQEKLKDDNTDLYKVFNRDFSNAYLKGDIHKNMFIDNPRDHSIKQFSRISNHSTHPKLMQDKLAYYDTKEDIISSVRKRIQHLSIEKTPLVISISGELGDLLSVSVETPDTSFTVRSQINLSQKNNKSSAQCLNRNILSQRFNSLNNTKTYIQQIKTKNLQENLFISFKELASIKNTILSILNGSKKMIAPIEVPFLKKQKPLETSPELGILINSQKDLDLCKNSCANFFFQLPNYLKKGSSEFTDLFLNHTNLIPWFPSVLIEENYTAAVDFLSRVKPERIVTNNTGIAYEACKKKIPWIAGPYLNTANSFSLLCLKETFNCSGAFISNELSKHQIKRIIPPGDFKLYYSLYHPIVLLSSRQCLLHQVIGCEKNTMDEECILNCDKSSFLTNEKKASFYIKKTKGNYHCIYNNNNFLNTDIVSDLPGVFSSFFIDLRDIKTETIMDTDKSGLIALFENLLNKKPNSNEHIEQMLHPTTRIQYKKGI